MRCAWASAYARGVPYSIGATCNSSFQQQRALSSQVVSVNISYWLAGLDPAACAAFSTTAATACEQ